VGKCQLLAATAVTLALAAASGGCRDSKPTSQPGCLPAKISGRVQCLRIGLQCERRYEHLYVLYGFTCRRNKRDDHFRLRERLFVAPANP
jgi:hypothetical protein